MNIYMKSIIIANDNLFVNLTFDSSHLSLCSFYCLLFFQVVIKVSELVRVAEEVFHRNRM
jgi:hypothetical protein